MRRTYIDLEGFCLKSHANKRKTFLLVKVKIKMMTGGASSGTECVNFPSFINVK